MEFNGGWICVLHRHRQETSTRDDHDDEKEENREKYKTRIEENTKWTVDEGISALCPHEIIQKTLTMIVNCFVIT